MSVGAPFSNHVGTSPAIAFNLTRQFIQVSVGIDPVKVQTRAAFFDEKHLGGVQARGDSRHGMVRILALDHGGNVLHGIPHIGVAVVQIDFISDRPCQEGGMVLELINDLGKHFQLGRHTLRIVIIKPVALVLHPQTHHHGDAVAVCFIQNFFGIVMAPSPDAVAPKTSDIGDVFDPSCAPHIVG